MTTIESIGQKYHTLPPTLSERVRRLWAGTEARALGRGGIAVVARATGLARNTVVRGLSELDAESPLDPAYVRRAGAGRKRKAALNPSLKDALEGLVEPVTRGDPESPLRWTCKRTRGLARELTSAGYPVSHVLVADLLHAMAYSLQANRKTIEGTSHPDRVAAIRRWWRELGRKAYPHATTLPITADSGGSNGSRLRLWKWELQRFANTSGLTIAVSHLPPGTRKWNKIEHRRFAFIAQNWRGQPLLTHATIVNPIANTRTTTGLKVHCVLDTHTYPAKTVVTDKQMAQLQITRADFHGDWNYTIHPHASHGK